MYSITNGILYCEFTVSSKDSSGRFTVEATIYNTSSNTRAIGEPRLSLSLTNEEYGWEYIKTNSIEPGSHYSGSYTFSTGSTAKGVVYCFLKTDNISGKGGPYDVDAYVDPTPEMRPITLSVSPSSQVMGEVVNVSETGGYYATVNDRKVLLGSTKIASYSAGQWRPSISTFEPYCTNKNYVDLTLQAYCVASSGAEGHGNSNSVSLRLTVPNTYRPDCSYYKEIINPINEAIIAGQSGLKITIEPTVVPSGNTATISSYILQSIVPVNTDTVPITVSSFTQNDKVFTCQNIPIKSNVPSYQFKMVFRITDSRGNVLDYETEIFRVSNFVPPLIQINTLTRKSAHQGIISITIQGQESNPSRIDNTNNTIASLTIDDGETTPVRIDDIKSNLVQTSMGYIVDYNITGLTSGKQYNVSFTYKDLTMYSYGESQYVYRKLLSTLSMPLSLYDDGYNIYVSFGEECSDGYDQDLVVNFAKDIYLRYIDNNDNVVCEKVQDVLKSCPYEIGDIFQTIDETTPDVRWPGTSWQQLTDRFLIGAGNTYSVEDTGGEATHTLTIQEMPSHNHSVTIRNNPTFETDVNHDRDTKTVRDDNQDDTYTTTSTGGGQPHNNMPPYYAVYMWLRTA